MNKTPVNKHLKKRNLRSNRRMLVEEKIFSKHFLLLAKRNSCEKSRLIMAISKKMAPGAVNRNRIKRIIRESFRCNQECLHNKDVLVIAKTPLSKLENNIVRSDIERQWKRFSK